MIREAEEGFGETMVLTSGLVKGPATLVSREPGELATIYLEQEIVVIGKTGDSIRRCDQYAYGQPDSCQDQKKRRRILSDRSEFQKWNIC